MPAKPACKDCGSVTRKVTRPGPRCATCKRKRKNEQRELAWERSIMERYGLSRQQYDLLYSGQDGRCYICRRATGQSRRLSVDHDHATGYVRGLLCRPCNTLLGRFRDEPAAFYRAGTYLTDPPAFNIIGKVKADGG